MLLLTKPPYHRWALACLIVVAAIGWDLSDRATEEIPFAITAIGKGETITDDKVEWRTMPRGAIEPADLSNATALTSIGSGDPLTRSVAGPEPSIPEGWWSVPADLPPGVPTGSAVRMTLADGTSAAGVVAVAATTDQFGLSAPGAVAVPEDVVDAVATAAASGTLLIVVAP